MDIKFKEIIYSILEKNQILSLTTLNNKTKQLDICSVFYVFDKDFNLFFWSDINSIHSNNITQNNLVAVNIVDTHQKWGSGLQGLQIQGKAYPLSITKMLKPAKLYSLRYPLVKKLINHLKDFNIKYNSKLYKIGIDKIKIFDEINFGKEGFKEFIIERK